MTDDQARWRERLAAFRLAADSRDALIIGAYGAGLGKSEIHETTRIARSTIDRVLAAHARAQRRARNSAIISPPRNNSAIISPRVGRAIRPRPQMIIREDRGGRVRPAAGPVPFRAPGE